MQILLSHSQAGPGRKAKQGQEEICRNHVPTFFSVLYYQYCPCYDTINLKSLICFRNVSIKQLAVRKNPTHSYFPSKSLFLLLCSPSPIACVMPEIPKIFPPIGASICARASEGAVGRARFSSVQPDFLPYEEEEFVNSVDLALVAKSTRRGCQL